MIGGRIADPPAPDGAAWYIGAIYFGHSVEYFVSGDSKTFHAGVKARVLSHDFGKFRAAAEKYGLQWDFKTRGLAKYKDKDLVMAKSLDELGKYYQEGDNLVPILVEYRSLRKQPNVGEAIKFAAPPPSFYRYTVQLLKAQVEPGKCDGGACSLVVQATPLSGGEPRRSQVLPRTNDPVFGGYEIIRNADVDSLGRGFMIQIGNSAPGIFYGYNIDQIATCQFAKAEEELTAFTSPSAHAMTLEYPCNGVKLNLRILRTVSDGDSTAKVPAP